MIVVGFRTSTRGPRGEQPKPKTRKGRPSRPDRFKNIRKDRVDYVETRLMINYPLMFPPLPMQLRRCLHDTRSSFIPVRLHPGSILSIYICLHDTNQNCIPERVIPERLHPGSRIGSKFSFQNEICLHVPPVSCKGGMGSFRYGNKLVDWLG